MQRYQSVFPSFEILDIVLPSGFIDESHPDHAMPTFTKALPNGNILRLWVDFIDKSKSKFPNDPRFCLSVYNSEFERLHDDIKLDNWFHTQIFIRGLIEQNTVTGPNR